MNKSTRCYWLSLGTVKSGPHTETEKCWRCGEKSHEVVVHVAAVALWWCGVVSCYKAQRHLEYCRWRCECLEVRQTERCSNRGRIFFDRTVGEPDRLQSQRTQWWGYQDLSWGQPPAVCAYLYGYILWGPVWVLNHLSAEILVYPHFLAL